MAAQGVQVTIEETRKFSHVWRYRGIVILMDDVHLQFATDFANVALQSFLGRVRASQVKSALVSKVNEHADVSGAIKS